MKFNSLSLLLALLCLFLVGSALMQLHFESKKTEKDISIGKVSDFYLRDYPIQRENTLGSGSIQIIAFFDPLSDTNAFFEAIDAIYDSYVVTGRATLLVNPIVLAGQDNTLAEQFLCMQQNKSNTEFFKNSKNESLKTISCQLDLTDRIEESEYLGLHGLNARFYIGLGQDYELLEGIASAGQLERAIRLKEITIGK